MTKFRQILAFMFAILIASPACCCFATPAPVKEAAHSCCGSGNEKKPDKNCDCSVKKQSVAESDKPLPHAPAFTVPTILEFPRPVSVEAIPAPNRPSWVSVDTGPPRLKLAIYQTFLI
ncbi:MAG TPA: hypothetical protein VM511_00965 [Luteolibacter sp.]|nr:hypothetical protein [Luteolibacter sp.]